MATTDDARRESESARQRLNEIARQLAARTSPEELKAMAKEKGEELTERAKVKVADLKEEAREKAVEKAHELKEKAVDTTTRVAGNRTIMAALGALAGAQLGVWLARSDFVQRRRMGDGRTRGWPATQGYGETVGYGAYGEGATYAGPPGGTYMPPQGAPGAIDTAKDTVDTLKAKAEHAGEAVKEKAEHLREAMKEKAEAVREKIPTGAEIRAKSHDYAERTSQAYHHAAEEYPWALALGAIGFGVIASLLVPASDKERRALADMKRKAQEGIERLGEQVNEKLASGTHEETPSTTSTGPLVTGMNEYGSLQ